MIYKYEDFKKIQRISEGTYGEVYKSINLITNEIVAIKKFKKMEESDEIGVDTAILREISLLERLKHPNIMKMKQTIRTPTSVLMVMEFLDIDLDKFIRTRDPLDKDLVKNFSYQLLQGVHYCHLNMIMHRDLKPCNILIDLKKSIIKIADWGMARKETFPHSVYTQPVVTLYYRAPELFLGTDYYNMAIDIWSVACIIAEMNNGTTLFPGQSEVDMINKIFKLLGTPDENSWPDVEKMSQWKTVMPNNPRIFEKVMQKKMDPLMINLLMKMLHLYPPHRLDCRRALLHPYFDDLDKNSVPASNSECNVPETTTIFHDKFLN